VCRGFAGNGNPARTGNGGGNAAHDLTDPRAVLLVVRASDESGNSDQGQHQASDKTLIAVQNPTPRRQYDLSQLPRDAGLHNR
jgi:hypothetical protein